MEPEAFSSNWKKLQSTLRKEHSSSSKERQNGARVVEKEKHQSAPRKGRSTPTHAEELSSPKTDEAVSPSEHSKSLTGWAVDNDIAISDLAKAYGSEVEHGLTGGPLTDVLNEGVSSK